MLTTSSQGMPDTQGPLVARLASLLLWLSSLLRSTSRRDVCLFSCKQGHLGVGRGMWSMSTLGNRQAGDLPRQTAALVALIRDQRPDAISCPAPAFLGRWN